MKFNIVTLYPSYFESSLELGILKKAISRNIISVNIVNLRDFAIDKRGSVDDTPYGGGAGMVLRVDVLYKALENIRTKDGYSNALSPRGKRFTQEISKELSLKKEINIFSGRFEGFDERFLKFVDLELSLGDFILSGGESAVLSILDSVVRLLPGVLGNNKSLEEESFVNNLLEYPQYTKPKEFKGARVPSVLLSGNHEEIKEWRLKMSKIKTGKIKNI